MCVFLRTLNRIGQMFGKYLLQPQIKCACLILNSVKKNFSQLYVMRTMFRLPFADSCVDLLAKIYR